VFGKELMTPAPEPYFNIRWVLPEDFEPYRNYANVVIASLTTPADSTGDVLVRHILGEERLAESKAGGNPIFVTSDFLARGQMFMGLVASDAIHAQAEINRLSTWIYDQFDQQMRIRQERFVYRYAPERELVKEFEEKYDFNLRIQRDYLKIKEIPDKNFVWLGKGFPYRWIGIHWVDNADSIVITRENAWEQNNLIADELFGDVYIDSLYQSTELGVENDHEIMILRGVWAHKEQTAGGPFFTYIFRDREQNRIYYVMGLVFNPGGSKALLIKRQELIIRSFHTFKNRPVHKKVTRADSVA
ncbi:DUF4837 family protein, partial [Candidatus Neomarinimicrobiota bacterium]